MTLFFLFIYFFLFTPLICNNVQNVSLDFQEASTGGPAPNTADTLDAVTHCNISISIPRRLKILSSEFFFADDVGLFLSTGSVAVFVDVDDLAALPLNAEVHAV